MVKLTSKKLLSLLMNGTILESYNRYYRYNSELNEVQYSDDMNNWKTSAITINDFIKVTKWNIVESK